MMLYLATTIIRIIMYSLKATSRRYQQIIKTRLQANPNQREISRRRTQIPETIRNLARRISKMRATLQLNLPQHREFSSLKHPIRVKLQRLINHQPRVLRLSHQHLTPGLKPLANDLLNQQQHLIDQSALEKRPRARNSLKNSANQEHTSPINHQRSSRSYTKKPSINPIHANEL